MYSEFLELMNSYITDIGWSINIQNLSPTINFFIKDGDDHVGFVTMVFTESTVPVNSKGIFRSIRTRHSIEKDVPCIYIQYIEVSKSYNGKNIGTFLIWYGIFYMLTQYPDTQIITLHDDSDRSTNVKNIYNFLGFSFVDEVSLNVGEKTLNISSPSKILTVERFNSNILTTKKYPVINIEKNYEINLKFIDDWKQIFFSRGIQPKRKPSRKINRKKTKRKTKLKFRNII